MTLAIGILDRVLISRVLGFESILTVTLLIKTLVRLWSG